MESGRPFNIACPSLSIKFFVKWFYCARFTLLWSTSLLSSFVVNSTFETATIVMAAIARRPKLFLIFYSETLRNCNALCWLVLEEKGTSEPSHGFYKRFSHSSSITSVSSLPSSEKRTSFGSFFLLCLYSEILNSSPCLFRYLI